MEDKVTEFIILKLHLVLKFFKRSADMNARLLSYSYSYL